MPELTMAGLLGPLVLMGLIAFGCRAAGFWAMRHVSPSPRLGAALAAIPAAVIASILVPTAVGAGMAEFCALIVAAVLMAWRGNDLIAVAGGLALLLLLRAAGL